MKPWLAALLMLAVAAAGPLAVAAEAPPVALEKKVTKKNPPKPDTQPKPDKKTEKTKK